jgi:chaperonin GroEL
MSKQAGAPSQRVVFFPKAHEELFKGATVLANAVASTMGPSGHSVIIDMETGPPLITKDGVTVAKSINLRDKLQSMGAELLKEVASKTNEIAGDGTTTATVLGHAIFAEGLKMISTGRSAIDIKKGMDKSADIVVDYLKQTAIPISSREDIINVGTISANGDRSIGELLAKAIERVGNDGIITVEPAKSVETTLDIVEGMQLDAGYVSPFFITNSERATCELDNPYILITPNKISSIQDIVGLLEGVLRTSRPLLIVADDVEGEALHTLIVNKTKGVVKVCAIKAPSYGEHRADILSDIQVLTGGTVFNATTDLTLKKASLSHMGSAKKVIIGRSSTTIISDLDVDRKNALEDRIRSLRTSLTEDKTLDALHVDKYRKRLARLSGGVAVIKVGGSTEVEILEKKDRVEDAVNATLAATQEGIVPGGGTALFYAANHLREHIKLKQANASGDYTQDELAGMEIIANVCEYPLNTIVSNTGASPDVIKERLKAATTGHKVFYIDTENADVEDLVSAVRHFKNKSETKKNDRRYGYNAAKGTYGDLVSEGIIDPVKVTRFALQHAVSVIGLTLSCNSVIVNEEEN